MKRKAPTTEASRSGSRHEDEPDITGVVYDDTVGALEKGGDFLKWGDVYQMFKKQNFLVDAEDEDKLKVFKNIRKSGIHRVATHATVFSCFNAISLTLKHVYLKNMYICNAKGTPIASFQLTDLAKIYNLEKGTKVLNDEFLGKFKCMAKDFFNTWYKPNK